MKKDRYRNIFNIFCSGHTRNTENQQRFRCNLSQTSHPGLAVNSELFYHEPIFREDDGSEPAYLAGKIQPGITGIG